jgi:hypothetical protein
MHPSQVAFPELRENRQIVRTRCALFGGLLSISLELQPAWQRQRVRQARWHPPEQQRERLGPERQQVSSRTRLQRQGPEARQAIPNISSCDVSLVRANLTGVNAGRETSSAYSHENIGNIPSLLLKISIYFFC